MKYKSLASLAALLPPATVDTEPQAVVTPTSTPAPTPASVPVFDLLSVASTDGYNDQDWTVVYSCRTHVEQRTMGGESLGEGDYTPVYVVDAHTHTQCYEYEYTKRNGVDRFTIPTPPSYELDVNATHTMVVAYKTYEVAGQSFNTKNHEDAVLQTLHAIDKWLHSVDFYTWGRVVTPRAYTGTNTQLQEIWDWVETHELLWLYEEDLNAVLAA